MWSIVLPAGISSSIQNKSDSSGPTKAVSIAVFKRIGYRNGAEAYGISTPLHWRHKRLST
jgi:hypothetical protein